MFCAWLAADSGEAEDSTTGGATDTVIHVVDVRVTVSVFCCPKVQKDVGAPPACPVHVVEGVTAASVLSDPLGWYENNASLVTMIVDASLSGRDVALETTSTSADVSASCENGSDVMPWMGANESEGLPAYG